MQSVVRVEEDQVSASDRVPCPREPCDALRGTLLCVSLNAWDGLREVRGIDRKNARSLDYAEIQLALMVLRILYSPHSCEQFWVKVLPAVLRQVRSLAPVAVVFGVICQVPDDPEAHGDGAARADRPQQCVLGVVPDVIHEVMAHASP